MIKRILSVSCVLLITHSFVNIAFAGPSVTAKENLTILLATKSCPGCDLSGLNFNRMDLSKVNLEGADLSMSTFLLTNLAYANLKDTTLNGAVFGGADLGDADLTGADLRGVSLDSAYLGETKMTGEIVTTKPFEDIGVEEVEKDVYVESQAIPKKTPQPQEVKVNERRVFSETPPVIASVETKEENLSEEIKPVKESSPPETTVPAAPPAKKSAAMQQVTVPIVEEEINDKEVEEELVVVDTKEENDSVDNVLVESQSTKVASVSMPIVAEIEISPEKQLNLEVLFDTKSCYACDLSGLDLSGKNLKRADLEKANLSGANLEKADLKGANLKGAILVGTNLKKANLKDADLYKSNLTGADLTGAKQKNVSFDGALIDDVTGLDMPLMLQTQ